VKVHAAVLVLDVRLPGCGSLKERRSALAPITEGARRRFGVAASEVAHQDRLQRAGLAFAAVAPAPGRVEEVLDSVERFVWSFPEVEVISARRDWVEDSS
jgi:uncharacterized protein YlxP (DUF503 family)